MALAPITVEIRLSASLSAAQQPRRIPYHRWPRVTDFAEARLRRAERALAEGQSEVESQTLDREVKILKIIATSLTPDQRVTFRAHHYEKIKLLIERMKKHPDRLRPEQMDDVIEGICCFAYSGFVSRLIEILSTREDYPTMLRVCRSCFDYMDPITALKGLVRLGAFYYKGNTTIEERQFLEKLLQLNVDYYRMGKDYRYILITNLLLGRSLEESLKAISALFLKVNPKESWNPQRVLYLLETHSIDPIRGRAELMEAVKKEFETTYSVALARTAGGPWQPFGKDPERVAERIKHWTEIRERAHARHKKEQERLTTKK